MRPRDLPAVLLLAGSVLAGCAGQGAAGPSSSPGATPDRRSPDGSVLPSPTGELDVPAEVLGPLVVDAGQRANAAPDEVAVVSATSVTWNDGSWGCPQPGVMYTQALVDGWQVVLEAAGQRFDYRTVEPGRFRICEGVPGT